MSNTEAKAPSQPGKLNVTDIWNPSSPTQTEKKETPEPKKLQKVWEPSSLAVPSSAPSREPKKLAPTLLQVQEQPSPSSTSREPPKKLAPTLLQVQEQPLPAAKPAVTPGKLERIGEWKPQVIEPAKQIVPISTGRIKQVIETVQSQNTPTETPPASLKPSPNKIKLDALPFTSPPRGIL